MLLGLEGIGEGPRARIGHQTLERAAFALRPATPSHEDTEKNLMQPGPQVGTWLILGLEAERPLERFLHEVLREGPVACQPEGTPVELRGTGHDVSAEASAGDLAVANGVALAVAVAVAVEGGVASRQRKRARP